MRSSCVCVCVCVWVCDSVYGCVSWFLFCCGLWFSHSALGGCAFGTCRHCILLLLLLCGRPGLLLSFCGLICSLCKVVVVVVEEEEAKQIKEWMKERKKGWTKTTTYWNNGIWHGWNSIVAMLCLDPRSKKEEEEEGEDNNNNNKKKKKWEQNENETWLLTRSCVLLLTCTTRVCLVML